MGSHKSKTSSASPYGTAISGPTSDFTKGNQVNILNAKSDNFEPQHTHVVQNTGRNVDINGGITNGVEHVVFHGLQNLNAQAPNAAYGGAPTGQYFVLLV